MGHLAEPEDFGSEFLNWLAERAAAHAVEIAGITEEAAMMIGEQLAVDASNTFPAQPIYLASGRKFRARRTEQLIVSTFAKNGYKAAKTARELKISATHVYRVVERHEAPEKALRQGKLTLD